MRTEEEVLARLRAINGSEEDFLGWRSSVLLAYLPYEKAKEFFGVPDNDLEQDWDTEIRRPNDEAHVREEIREYLIFAMDKMDNHRGISASRSVLKMGEWVWLVLGDDASEVYQSAPYENYGAPAIKTAADLFGLQDVWVAHLTPVIEKMVRGKACRLLCPDCHPWVGALSMWWFRVRVRIRSRRAAR